jgi:hypothetical protein
MFMVFSLPSLLPEFGFGLFYQLDLAFAFNRIRIDNALLNVVNGWNIEHGFP